MDPIQHETKVSLALTRIEVGILVMKKSDDGIILSRNICHGQKEIGFSLRMRFVGVTLHPATKGVSLKNDLHL